MLSASEIEVSHGNTDSVDVQFNTTYDIQPSSYTPVSDIIINTDHCVPQRDYRITRRACPCRMANDNESIAIRNRTISHAMENPSRIGTQGQRNMDKRQNNDESIEIIEISDENNGLSIQNISSSDGLTSNSINTSQATSTVNNIGLNSSNRTSNAESPVPTEIDTRSNINNMNPSILSKVYLVNNKNTLLPSTSSTLYSRSWDNEITAKHKHETNPSEICGNDTIRGTKIANKLIKLSRCLKTPNFDDLSCLSCRRLPVTPVTGKCGHTRCMRCTLTYNVCPCGIKAPDKPNENIELRGIIEKMMKFVKRLKSPKKQLTIRDDEQLSSTLQLNMRLCQRRSLTTRGVLQHILRPRVPMSAQARYKKARELISAGLYAEAASNLARVAASTEPCARFARRLLNKTLTLIYQENSHKDVSRELNVLIREQSIQSWLHPGDLECVLCTNTYREPVSTPCGHTFCRCCIERSMYYRRRCALCSGPLENFSLVETSNNVFFSAILNCMDIPPLPLEPDIIPIVISYVAFPGLPCPLFIKNSRHWLMVLRILKSGSRRFGMLSYERDHTLADYGMVLEICDCVIFEDNRCIVSTVGISRFKVIERDVRDGCDVARIRQLVDVTPTKEEVSNILMLTENIASKALNWLETMKLSVREEIETAFGTWPIWQEAQAEWWNTTDGPAWLWWIIAILPLTKEGKVHILSTQGLLTRMVAVLRTFEVMDGSLIYPSIA